MTRFRIKEYHNPYLLPDGRIRIGSIQYGVGAELQDNGARDLWALLHLIDGTRTEDEIALHMEQTRRVDAQSVREAISQLAANGFLENADPQPTILSAREVARYSRSTNFFSWIDTRYRHSSLEIQETLSRSSVTIVGLGGTGGAVAQSLVATGVGKVHLVDFDVVEETNLTRQLLFRESDIGKSKTAAAAAHLRDLNRFVEISTENCRISSMDDMAQLMVQADLLMLCADRPLLEIQRWTNRAALRTNTPWVLALYAGPMTVVGSFAPPDSPCYECIEIADQNFKRTQGIENPTYLNPELPAVQAALAPAANLSGHLGALEAIYLLGGLMPTTLGRIFHQCITSPDHVYFVGGEKMANCLACGTETNIATTIAS